MQLRALCEHINAAGIQARLDGNDHDVTAVATLEDAADGQISFLSNPKYADALKTTSASAVIVKNGVTMPDGIAAVRCDDPYAGVTAAIIILHGHRRHSIRGISPQATIHPEADVADDANIGPYVTIAAGAAVGRGCTIYPGCYLGDRATLGQDCTLFPNVVVYDDSRIGNRVTIHAGSVIGEDGLGYAPKDEKWIKIPQVGRVEIGDDVEIGANCAIDRATLGKTEIQAGTKFGNTIVIGHGTKIGRDCLFVGQVGVAGSVNVGRHVTLAGQVGVAGHLSIGDNVRVGGQSGISGDIEPDTELLGSPAMPIDKARRAAMAVQKLPDWIKRIKDLEREVEQLRQRLESQER